LKRLTSAGAIAIVAAAGLAATFTGSPAGAPHPYGSTAGIRLHQPAAVQAEQALTAQTAAALGLAGV